MNLPRVETEHVRSRGEHEILDACRAGDREAFRELFEIHSGRVRSVALHFFGGDGGAADDVVQAVFVKLHARIPQFRGDSQLSTWLHRLVVNTCLDDRRAGRRLLPLETVDGSDPGRVNPAQAEAAERGQRERRVRAAVASLPPKLRIAVLLRHFEELSYDEMAAALGCSSGTVASRLNRGHAALSRTLAEFAPKESPR